MRCLVCGKLAVKVSDSLPVCIDHYNEKVTDSPSFISRYGFQNFLLSEGYHYNAFLRTWIKACDSPEDVMQILE